MVEQDSRTPGRKLLIAVLIALALAIPIFCVWMLVYDRQSQSEQARSSITEGWGGEQTMSGPVLVIPFRQTISEQVGEGAQRSTRSREVWREMMLEPENVDLATTVAPELRKRSIYEAVVYSSENRGSARFAFPPDLDRFGVDVAQMDLSRAELRFGLSDPRGLGANPKVSIDGRATRLQPGGGSGQGKGFFTFVDAAGLTARPMAVGFDYQFRGHSTLAVAPRAGDTRWRVASSWPSPSFGGDFLPAKRQVGKVGFSADYGVGNLALGRSLVSVADKGSSNITASGVPTSSGGVVVRSGPTEQAAVASIELIQPVDLYSRVDRATKYGFLFIGFTFLALLMFDVIGEARVSAVEYLLMGAAIVLFFVLLLAFAEVIGFTSAFILASAAIAGLNTAYSAAVLGSWKRGAVIGGLLVALYAVLYILLGLEAFALLIGSVLLFVALAGVMYATRRIDWSGVGLPGA